MIEQQGALNFVDRRCLFLSLALEDNRNSSDGWENRGKGPRRRAVVGRKGRQTCLAQSSEVKARRPHTGYQGRGRVVTLWDR